MVREIRRGEERRKIGRPDRGRVGGVQSVVDDNAKDQKRAANGAILRGSGVNADACAEVSNPRSSLRDGGREPLETMPLGRGKKTPFVGLGMRDEALQFAEI